MALEAGQAVVLDCHKPHEYASCSLGEWDFLWMHFHGREPEGILEILYPDMTEAITVTDAEEFRNKMSDLMYRIKENDVISCMEISAGIHELLNLLKKSGMEQERIARKKNQMEDVEAVLAFIRKNYASPITVEDMVRDIHVSKYHFIRMFGRKMGVTPYHYLMNYRINQSKMLLGTTDKTIEMIAQECGFSSASNFIAQFKKQTGQKPLQYRKDFIML
jgi:AraC-like DNA-binding protein